MLKAIFEAAFCAVGLSIRQAGEHAILSFKTFYENRINARIAKENNKRYLKTLAPGELGYLVVEVGNIRKIGNLYSVDIHFIREE
jgi:hypothetical protein